MDNLNQNISETIRVLLVEDHQLVREGTRQLLELTAGIKVIGEAGDGENAIKMTQQLKPDVVIMDIRLPGINGVEATKQIISNNPDTHILILSAYEEDRYIFPLLEAGASGYLLKTASAAELADAIRSVHAGNTALDPHIASHLVHRLTHKQKYRSGQMVEGLTERELMVLKAVALGKSNKEIGVLLSISANTVQVHLRNIFEKLNVNDRTEAAAYAIKQGWISLHDDEEKP